MKTCVDCGAPVGDDLLPNSIYGCWYKDQMREKFRREGRSQEDWEAFDKCGADLPCDCNNYEQEAYRRERRFGRNLLLTLVALFALLLAGLLSANAQLTLSCDQVRSLYIRLGQDEFVRQSIQLGLTEAQMKAAMSCIERRR